MVPQSSLLARRIKFRSYGVRLTRSPGMFKTYIHTREYVRELCPSPCHTYSSLTYRGSPGRALRVASRFPDDPGNFSLSLSLSLSLSRCSLNCVWPLSLAHEGDLSRLGHRLSPLTIADSLSLTSGELSSLALLVHVLAYPRRALHLIMDGRSGQLSSTGRVRGRRACAQLHRRESRLRPLGAAPSRPTQPTAGGASSASLPASGPCSYDELPAPP